MERPTALGGQAHSGSPDPREPAQPELRTSRAATLERALGALYGALIGDAMGAATRYLSPAEIGRLFPRIEWFPQGQGDGDAPPAGTITKTGELVTVVGDIVLEGGGRVDARVLAERLGEWAADGHGEAPRTDPALVDQAILRALDGLRKGDDIEVVGRFGDTNGCLPGAVAVGLATPPRPLSRLIDRVEEVCRPTHNTQLAIAGAAALAAAVSDGIAGATLVDALSTGEEAAELGSERGQYVSGASVADRIDWALELAARSGPARALGLIAHLIGTGSHVQETLPVAFAVAFLWSDDPWRVCLEAARMGGDSSSIGASAAALVGSVCGLSAFPGDAVNLVRRVNKLRLRELTQGLLYLREGAVAAADPTPEGSEDG